MAAASLARLSRRATTSAAAAAPSLRRLLLATSTAPAAASAPPPPPSAAAAAAVGADRVRWDYRGQRQLVPLGQWMPKVAVDAYVAPEAVLAGQVTVHDGGSLDQAAYSVSLVDGFNVPVVVSPQAIAGGGQCPALGCPVDLNCDCPPPQRAAEGVACRGPPEYFKNRCPLTRTTPTDVEPVPQSCRAPGELKIVFCQATIVTGAAAAAAAATEGEMVIRSVVADS